MNFFQKLKQSFAIFMRDRYGADELSRVLLIIGIALYILSMIFRLPLLSTIGLALYIFTIFRMFSKNRYKRSEENRKYLLLKNKLSTEYKQAKIRYENRKEYKYLKCPKCKTRIRLPRNIGNVTINCKQCGNKFDAKG